MREYIRKLWLRNLLSLTILGIFCFGFFWAGAAWGAEPEEKKSSAPAAKAITTTTTTTLPPSTTTSTTATTTTAPPVKPVITAPKAPPAPIVPEGEIQQYIHDQAVAHGLDPARMLRIAKCESGFRPDAINRSYYAGGGNPSGIYQYLPETWTRISSRSGLGVGNVFDWQQNVRVTMWAFANGYANEWACK